MKVILIKIYGPTAGTVPVSAPAPEVRPALRRFFLKSAAGGGRGGASARSWPLSPRRRNAIYTSAPLLNPWRNLSGGTSRKEPHEKNLSGGTSQEEPFRRNFSRGTFPEEAVVLRNREQLSALQSLIMTTKFLYGDNRRRSGLAVAAARSSLQMEKLINVGKV